MTTEELLDMLSEYQAQQAAIEMQKRELLDQVKIPAEVLNAQDEANKRRQAIDSAMWNRQKLTDQIRNESLAQVVDPEMPPEFVAALEEARRKRAEIMSAADAQNVANRLEANEAKVKIDTDLQAQVKEVYAQVETRKREIAAEFADKEQAVENNIAALTDRVKESAKADKKTVKGQYLMAVYVNGRVTWNTDMLDGMIVVFPALEKARNRIYGGL